MNEDQERDILSAILAGGVWVKLDTIFEDEEGVPLLIQRIQYLPSLAYVTVVLFTGQKLIFDLDTAIPLSEQYGPELLMQVDLSPIQYEIARRNLEPIILAQWHDGSDERRSRTPRRLH